MWTITSVRLVIIFVFLSMNVGIFYLEQADLEYRTQKILEEHINKLQNNYINVLNQFQTLSQNTFNAIVNQKDVIDILYRAKHSRSEVERALLRQKLYKKMKPHFEKLKKMGVIIMLFSEPNNKTFLRIHKPSKFDDDLSKVRFSFVHVNKYQEEVFGFEQGNISHAFRNIYPIFDERKEYLGSIDIAFSSDTFEINMINLHEIETHFIVNKSVFESKIWESEKEVPYIQSIEHEDYLFSMGEYRKNYAFSVDEILFNKKHNIEIAKKIKQGNSFAINDESFIAVYAPVKNISDNKTVAYFVSYKHDMYLKTVIATSNKIHLFTFLGLFIIFFILYRNVVQKLLLEEKVKEKTQDLQYLNENLELEVRKKDTTFQTLFDKAPEGITLVNEDGFFEANEAILKMLRIADKEDLIGRSSAEFSPEFQPDGSPSKETSFKMIQKAKDEGIHSFEWLHVRSDGTEFWANITLTPIVLEDENFLHAVWRDISSEKHTQNELLEQKEELYHRANHDALTGLPNRELFHDRLEQMIKHSSRNKKMFAVFFMDLDRFKHINDSLGHQVGDEMLKEVSYRFLSAIRSADTLARLGGDEFTILMQDLSTPEDATKMAEKIIDSLSNPIVINEHTLYMSTSIGISLYPNDSLKSDELIMFADNAMYKAKEAGRNTYEFYSSDMTALVLGKVLMESNIRRSLEEQHFEVYFQPQINSLTNQVIGLEALARWKHPFLGFMTPDKFIPIAEETGLIVELDKYIMQSAMNQVSQWYENGLKPGILAINLSMKLLNRNDFFQTIKGFIDSSMLDCKFIEFEMTESQIMDNPQDTFLKLKSINNLGVSVAIDDFGTGYSSLSHLKKLPLDKLKIDKSFMDDIPEDEDDKMITKAIISLAKSLNLNVLAEGVETQEQKDFLLENGCSDIQGYYYSKPLSVKDTELFLRQRIDNNFK